ncbi:glutamate--cysteine ligase [Formicincola oecophyllae]|uniref:Glutamate--cysteine ligase n=1 Tax=Formicincola oecophyllae TaxID=2558361 RepID=A0A4Y6U6E2_9PROT|nr:glutamate-cysteine ligase family protein [Formicincola oecophyllae]QDH12912.1 glutamate--cysteine ligase [Formicincola oecophyllae]
MSTPGLSNATPLTSTDQLAGLLAAGSKPKGQWRIGTEHEKFGFVVPGNAARHPNLGAPLPYAAPTYKGWRNAQNPQDPGGIEDVLKGFEATSTESAGWKPAYDQGKVIALSGTGTNKGAAISLEPAGQFELSGAPLRTIHETKAELENHFNQLRPVAASLGLGFSPLGFQPLWRRSELPWMPKSRYAIMRAYMPKVGTMGLDMMQRTCTVQTNLDFGSEADMARKMRVSLALQPLNTALFANSPFQEGRLSGWTSRRALSWLSTDDARSGIVPSFFEDNFSFEAYVQWVLDVPMYFIIREGRYINAAGCSFRAWLAGADQAPLRGHRPTVGDFEDHLTTAFPDVRLKTFLEMRAADAGSPAMMVAHSALWTGLLYDEPTLMAAEALVREQPWHIYSQMRNDVPYFGMDSRLGRSGQQSLRPLAQRVVALAREGLKARGLGEERYLEPLEAIAAGAPTQAECWMELFEGEWGGDVRPLFQASAI